MVDFRTEPYPPLEPVEGATQAQADPDPAISPTASRLATPVVSLVIGISSSRIALYRLFESDDGATQAQTRLDSARSSLATRAASPSMALAAFERIDHVLSKAQTLKVSIEKGLKQLQQFQGCYRPESEVDPSRPITPQEPEDTARSVLKLSVQPPYKTTDRFDLDPPRPSTPRKPKPMRFLERFCEAWIQAPKEKQREFVEAARTAKATHHTPKRFEKLIPVLVANFKPRLDIQTHAPQLDPAGPLTPSKTRRTLSISLDAVLRLMGEKAQGIGPLLSPPMTITEQRTVASNASATDPQAPKSQTQVPANPIHARTLDPTETTNKMSGRRRDTIVSAAERRAYDPDPKNAGKTFQKATVVMNGRELEGFVKPVQLAIIIQISKKYPHPKRASYRLEKEELAAVNYVLTEFTRCGLQTKERFDVPVKVVGTAMNMAYLLSKVLGLMPAPEEPDTPNSRENPIEARNLEPIETSNAPSERLGDRSIAVEEALAYTPDPKTAGTRFKTVMFVVNGHGRKLCVRPVQLALILQIRKKYRPEEYSYRLQKKERDAVVHVIKEITGQTHASKDHFDLSSTWIASSIDVATELSMALGLLPGSEESNSRSSPARLRGGGSEAQEYDDTRETLILNSIAACILLWRNRCIRDGIPDQSSPTELVNKARPNVEQTVDSVLKSGISPFKFLREVEREIVSAQREYRDSNHPPTHETVLQAVMVKLLNQPDPPVSIRSVAEDTIQNSILLGYSRQDILNLYQPAENLDMPDPDDMESQDREIASPARSPSRGQNTDTSIMTAAQRIAYDSGFEDDGQALDYALAHPQSIARCSTELMEAIFKSTTRAFRSADPTAWAWLEKTNHLEIAINIDRRNLNLPAMSLAEMYHIIGSPSQKDAAKRRLSRPRSNALRTKERAKPIVPHVSAAEIASARLRVFARQGPERTGEDGAVALRRRAEQLSRYPEPRMIGRGTAQDASSDQARGQTDISKDATSSTSDPPPYSASEEPQYMLNASPANADQQARGQRTFTREQYERIRMKLAGRRLREAARDAPQLLVDMSTANAADKDEEQRTTTEQIQSLLNTWKSGLSQLRSGPVRKLRMDLIERWERILRPPSGDTTEEFELQELESEEAGYVLIRRGDTPRSPPSNIPQKRLNETIEEVGYPVLRGGDSPQSPPSSIPQKQPSGTQLQDSRSHTQNVRQGPSAANTEYQHGGQRTFIRGGDLSQEAACDAPQRLTNTSTANARRQERENAFLRGQVEARLVRYKSDVSQLSGLVLQYRLEWIDYFERKLQELDNPTGAARIRPPSRVLSRIPQKRSNDAQLHDSASSIANGRPRRIPRDGVSHTLSNALTGLTLPSPDTAAHGTRTTPRRLQSDTPVSRSPIRPEPKLVLPRNMDEASRQYSHLWWTDQDRHVQDISYVPNRNLPHPVPKAEIWGYCPLEDVPLRPREEFCRNFYTGGYGVRKVWDATVKAMKSDQSNGEFSEARKARNRKPKVPFVPGDQFHGGSGICEIGNDKPPLISVLEVPSNSNSKAENPEVNFVLEDPCIGDSDVDFVYEGESGWDSNSSWDGGFEDVPMVF